jgi:hypothetical protein
MHLTNYAINKSSPDFVFNASAEDSSTGHKRSLSSVLHTLATEHAVDTEALMTKIHDIVVKTLAMV